MNQIEQVGIKTQTAADYIESWGKRLLIPTLIQNGNNTNIDELKGVEEFITMTAQKVGISFHEPEDVWKYATFITYIADSRDIAVLNAKDALILINSKVFDYKTNLLQAANFTLTTFSGECSAFARLYSASQYILGNVNTYSAYILGSAYGHATNVFEFQGKWYLINYYQMYEGDNPWQLVAYLWSEIYKNGWISNYSITFTQNIFYSTAAKKEESYLKPLASDSLLDLISSKIVRPDQKPSASVNFSVSPAWSGISAKAKKFFDITSFSQRAEETKILWIAIAVLAAFLILKGG